MLPPRYRSSSNGTACPIELRMVEERLDATNIKININGKRANLALADGDLAINVADFLSI